MFKPGDVVRLNGDPLHHAMGIYHSQPMTVVSFLGDSCQCVWFDSTKMLRREVFPIQHLELADDNQTVASDVGQAGEKT